MKKLTIAGSRLLTVGLFLSVHLIVASAIVAIRQQGVKTAFPFPPQLVTPFPLLMAKQLAEPTTIRLAIGLLLVDLVVLVIWFLIEESSGRPKKEVSQ